MDLKKLLVIDIETAGSHASHEMLKLDNPKLGDLWEARKKWLTERYPGNDELSSDELFKLKSGLHAEFGRVVCVTFGTFDCNALGEFDFKIVSFDGTDERDILEKANKVMANAGAAGYTLAGHTIERFDVPFLWKRMLINKIKPASIITLYDKKPWDVKMLDISKFWSGGSWQEGFTSLDTMATLFGFSSPKAEMQANRVHVSYYDGEYDKIRTYCEADVSATMCLIAEFAQTLTSGLVINYPKSSL